MKKSFKILLKTLIIDFIVVVIVSITLITAEMINDQSRSVDGKGPIENEEYVCVSSRNRPYHCDFNEMLQDNYSMLPLYIVLGGYIPMFSNPNYLLANYGFIVLLFNYLYFRRSAH